MARGTPKRVSSETPVPPTVNGTLTNGVDSGFPGSGILSKLASYTPAFLRSRSPKVLYLLAYNTTTALLWSYLLVLIVSHLAKTPKLVEVVAQPLPPPTKLQVISKLVFSKLFPGSTTLQDAPAQVVKQPTTLLAHVWDQFLIRARTTYFVDNIGQYTRILQSLAVLEVVHSAMGWVKSPVGMSAMQVAGRLINVWWTVGSNEKAQSSALYTSMVIAWSLSEIIRDSYYITVLLSLVPPPSSVSPALTKVLNTILWLRYSAFYILYPIGALSEAILISTGFPPLPAADIGAPVWTRFTGWFKLWALVTWFRATLFLAVVPTLVTLMAHLHAQRRKALRRETGHAAGHSTVSVKETRSTRAKRA